jgi:hypothetical protein
MRRELAGVGDRRVADMHVDPQAAPRGRRPALGHELPFGDRQRRAFPGRAADERPPDAVGDELVGQRVDPLRGGRSVRAEGGERRGDQAAETG